MKNCCSSYALTNGKGMSLCLFSWCWFYLLHLDDCCSMLESSLFDLYSLMIEAGFFWISLASIVYSKPCSCYSDDVNIEPFVLLVWRFDLLGWPDVWSWCYFSFVIWTQLKKLDLSYLFLVFGDARIWFSFLSFLCLIDSHLKFQDLGSGKRGQQDFILIRGGTVAIFLSW